jgi:hypothetical protein
MKQNSLSLKFLSIGIYTLLDKNNKYKKDVGVKVSLLNDLDNNNKMIRDFLRFILHRSIKLKINLEIFNNVR